jgi:hypothetical protein
MIKEIKTVKPEVKEEVINATASAFSKLEFDGKWHCVEVKFDPILRKAGEVIIVESNTDKFIIDERLHVLIFGSGLL